MRCFAIFLMPDSEAPLPFFATRCCHADAICRRADIFSPLFHFVERRCYATLMPRRCVEEITEDRRLEITEHALRRRRCHTLTLDYCFDAACFLMLLAADAFRRCRFRLIITMPCCRFHAEEESLPPTSPHHYVLRLLSPAIFTTITFTIDHVAIRHGVTPLLSATAAATMLSPLFYRSCCRCRCHATLERRQSLLYGLVFHYAAVAR